MSGRKERLQKAALYAIFGPESLDRPDFGERVRGAIEGGVDIVQFRPKGSVDAGRSLAICRDMASWAGEAGALFIVNDDPCLAAESGADGVHLGQKDGALSEARRLLGPGRLVGRSTHSLRQVEAAVLEGADYIGFGPVFGTPTKPDYVPVGLRDLGEVGRMAALPWFAIGGIDESNVFEVLSRGARRIAVVRAVASSPQPRQAAERLKNALLKQLETGS